MNVPPALIVLIVTPARPLWPALTVLQRLPAAFMEKQPPLQRLRDVYVRYRERADALAPLRAQTGEDLFDKHHRLSRVAARIGAFPARDYGSDPAKKKWFYFLHKELNKATQDAIKRILGDALSNSKIKAIAFSVEENAAASHPHLFPSNDEPLANYLDTTRSVYLVKMIVKAPLEDSNLDDPPGDEP